MFTLSGCGGTFVQPTLEPPAPILTPLATRPPAVAAATALPTGLPSIPPATLAATATPLPKIGSTPPPAGAPLLPYTPVPQLTPMSVSIPPIATAAPGSVNGEIVFTGNNGLTLFVMPASGGKPRDLLTVGDTGFIHAPAWSPDGKKIAMAYAPPVTGTLSTGPRGLDLYVLNADGTSLHKVAGRDTPNASLDTPVWSPDGQWLYFTYFNILYDQAGKYQGAVLRVSRAPAAGGDVEKVIGNASNPSVSPDGKHITYISENLDSGGQGIAVADIDGQNPRELVSPGTFVGLNTPRISPNEDLVLFSVSGERILPTPTPKTGALLGDKNDTIAYKPLAGNPFLSLKNPARAILPHSSAHGLPWDLWTVPLAGGELTRLTEVYEDTPVASWGSGGRYVAFLGIGGIYLMQANGSGLIRLKDQGGHGELDWWFPK
ncbi:MAG: PD40 domain-containing protein [Chloroflexi bacterium]|nr:PD40 domain-containing protein [Chloroflexota bacterium]